MATRFPPLQPVAIQGRPPESQAEVLAKQNSRMLIERASELKDAIVAHMMEDNGSPGMLQDKHMRGLLREHLYTVTSALTKLGHDIESLESQLSGRDQASVTSNTLMRSLEVQQATSVNDLRSRVARCDANISVLSSDLRKLVDSFSSLTLQMQNVTANQTKAEKAFENKLSKISESTHSNRSDYSSKLRNSETKYEQALAVLDTRLKNLISETGKTLQSIKLQEENAQDKLQRDISYLETMKAKREKKLEELEESVMKKLSSLDKRITKLEEDQKETKESLTKEIADLRQHFDSSLIAENKRLERKLRTQIDEYRQESTGGLKSLKESMTSLRAVLEGKQTLLEQDLRHEISLMKRLVVVT